MTLEEVIGRFATLDKHDVLFVRRPWGPDAECAVVRYNEEMSGPLSPPPEGHVYFLEVHVAHEVLEVFEQRRPTDDEVLRLLLHYAEHDAYPGWVYE